MALSLFCIFAIILITNFEELHLKKSFFTYGVENMQCHKKIEKQGIKLITTGIEMMYTDISIEDNYYKAVEEFYNKMKDDKDAFKIITKYLKRTISDTDALIKSGRAKLKENAKEESTQALLIYLYTAKSDHQNKHIYSTMNKMLRDHAGDCNVKTICDDELGIAPYAAALTATLLHWDGLKSTTEMTYRGIDITICEVNNPIVWVSFTSTSSDKTKAEEYGKVTFYSITQANVAEKWLPKDIAPFSDKPEEKEFLFHPGSVFKFTSTVHEETKITYEITLQDPTSNEYCNRGESGCN